MSEQTLDAALQKLAKWRSFFASWQLGTRTDTDGETKAVKHHREATILLRAEVTALAGLLIKKGIITQEEFQTSLEEEAGLLDKDYERAFPGFSTSGEGLHMDLPAAYATMRALGFPQ
jgi:hypothetical protein